MNYCKYSNGFLVSKLILFSKILMDIYVNPLGTAKQIKPYEVLHKRSTYLDT